MSNHHWMGAVRHEEGIPRQVVTSRVVVHLTPGGDSPCPRRAPPDRAFPWPALSL